MVTGSGNAARETRPLANWTTVALSCPGTLELAIGDNNGILIEADDNILELIETPVDGDTLQIRFKRGLRQIRPTTPIHFHATTPTIARMTVSGAGDISASAIDGDDLTLTISGSGNIHIESTNVGMLRTTISGAGTISSRGNATDIELVLSGSGSLDARDLTVQRARIQISGAGSALLRVEQELDGRISGSGSIIYDGAPSTTIRTSGSGRALRMPT